MFYKVSELASISTYHNTIITAFQVIWKCKFNLKGGSSWHCMSIQYMQLLVKLYYKFLLCMRVYHQCKGLCMGSISMYVYHSESMFTFIWIDTRNTLSASECLVQNIVVLYKCNIDYTINHNWWNDWLKRLDVTNKFQDTDQWRWMLTACLVNTDCMPACWWHLASSLLASAGTELFCRRLRSLVWSLRCSDILRAKCFAKEKCLPCGVGKGSWLNTRCLPRGVDSLMRMQRMLHGCWSR